MKVVCVGDAYVTPKMMEEGVKPCLAEDDSLEIYFFGQPDRKAMFDTVRKLELGMREQIAIPEGLTEAVVDADLLIVHLCPVCRSLLEKTTRLKAIMTCRGGKENIDVQAATDLGITLSNNPAHNANAVAEFAVGVILCETRNISRSCEALKKGEWRKTFPNTEATIRELCDMTVGIIGYGSIGRLVAEKLKPFGCRTLVFDPYAKNVEGVELTDKETLLRESDIVTLHARSDTAIIGEEEFGMMKRGSYLVNTARAHLVDQQAFRKAMDSGKLMGAAVDVFETEPEIPDFYRHYDNITITSHRGGDTINSYKDAPRFAIKNFLDWQNGKPLKFKAN